MGLLNVKLLDKYKQKVKKVMEQPTARKVQKQCKNCGKK